MKTSYSALAKALHWGMALLLIGLWVLGSFMTELPSSGLRSSLYGWHKSAGVLVWALVWVRLAWRWVRPPPPLPASVSPRMQRWAGWAHAGLYLLMITIPLSGWLMSSAKGYPTVWWGLVTLPDALGRDRVLAEVFEEVHEALNNALLGLVAVHGGAALWGITMC